MLRNGRNAIGALVSSFIICFSLLASEDAQQVQVADRPTEAADSLRSRPIRTDVNMVLVTVSVVDPVSDRLVTGLKKEYFEVFEDKKPQEVSQFSTEETPISLCVIFDLSGSMAEKVDKSRIALGQFFRLANPQDEFALVAFNDRPEKLSGFTSNPNLLETKLAFAEPKGRTALIDAVYLGLNEMRKAKHSRKVMVIISDGGDNHSRYTERDVRKAVKEADVQMYAVGIYETPENRARTPEELAGPSLLAELTGMTGGREFSIQNINDLPAAAERISREMRNVYILGYSPANQKHDGKWRKIQVKLRLPKNSPRLQLFSRSGYYAPVR